jgi:hypothetical protein
MSYNRQYSNTDLQTNNNEHDIENNINETQLPNFTLYYVTELDKNYRRHLPNITNIKYPHHIYDDLNECKIDNLITIFELNELFTEHIDNISQLTDYVRRYESLSKHAMKIQLYCQKIKPILEHENDNLNTVIELLYNNK